MSMYGVWDTLFLIKGPVVVSHRLSGMCPTWRPVALLRVSASRRRSMYSYVVGIFGKRALISG